jgi:hypothetical protein
MSELVLFKGGRRQLSLSLSTALALYSFANTMEPSHIKHIELELQKEAKWSVDKLVFEIPRSPPFHIIPYL